jgi:hypothetical protein
MYFWGLGLNTECGGVTSPHKNLVKTSKLGNHISLEAIEEPILLWLMYIAKAVAANIAAINFFWRNKQAKPSHRKGCQSHVALWCHLFFALFAVVVMALELPAWCGV